MLVFMPVVLIPDFGTVLYSHLIALLPKNERVPGFYPPYGNPGFLEGLHFFLHLTCDIDGNDAGGDGVRIGSCLRI